MTTKTFPANYEVTVCQCQSAFVVMMCRIRQLSSESTGGSSGSDGSSDAAADQLLPGSAVRARKAAAAKKRAEADVQLERQDGSV